VVVDEARGPAGAVAAFIWHLNNAKTVGESRFRLGTKEIMIIDETGSLRLENFDNNALTDVVALGQSRLKIVAVFLMR
jgi:hypothetical protein